jgi:hydrogenase-4 membrane subunit HyfE
LTSSVELACAAALLLLIVLAAVARTAPAGVAIYAWAAVPQAVVAAVLAATGGGPLLWVDAALILAIKAFWVPRILGRSLPVREGHDYGLATALSPPMLLGGAVVLALLGLRLGVLLGPAAGEALGLGLAAVILGFGLPAVRAELWAQSVGILLGEAALVLTALVLAGDLPPTAEVLALAEVILLAVVLGAVVRAVREVHGVADVRRLGRLRG